MFPRTSIDNAKAVRQNAQTLHGQIALSAGKRIAKYMPKVVGAWLCGLYDTDRSVTDATQGALRNVFVTPVKVQNIRKAYQQPILEYCRDAIDKETPLTLSDERTVSPDDAEAKYSRVISACISLLGSLLTNLNSPELSNYQSDYDALLGDKKIWEFASHGDASIRRSLHRFLKTCITKQPDAVNANLDAISKAYLSVALNSDQTGSAYDYVDALGALTVAYPTVWTVHYKSKTTVERRLRQFLKKGSQFGPREYWDRLVDIFKALPAEIIPRNGTDAVELLSSLHSGIIRKDESRLNLESAYRAYLQIASILSTPVTEDEQSKLLRDLVLPIILQYLRPMPEASEWTLPPNSGKIIFMAILTGNMQSIIAEDWPRIIQKFIDDIKTSAPEQSKDYKNSQSALIKQANRFATTQQYGVEATTSLQPVFARACSVIINEAITVVRNRNGKPFGVAGTIAELLSKNRTLVLADSDTKEALDSFIKNDLPKLILSPSTSYLVDILYSMSQTPSFKEAWAASLKTALSADDSPAKATALEAILTSSHIPVSFDLASSDQELQNYVETTVQSALQGTVEWDSFSRIIQSPSHILSSSTTDNVLSMMTQSLSLSEQAPSALQGFRQIVKQNPALLREFLSTSSGSSLLQSLLLASESPNDDIAQDAAAVNSSIQTLLSAGSDSKQSIFDVIHRGLQGASQTSVSVETLVDLAKQLVKPDSDFEQLKGVFPNIEDWDAALAPFLDVPPKSSLAITNPLTGAVYLVKGSETSSRGRQLPRDADGYSPAFRIAQYSTRIFKSSDLFQVDKLPSEVQNHFLRNMSLTLQLATDNLGLAGANDLWAVYNPEVETDVISFMSDAQAFITENLKQEASLWSESAKNASMLSWSMNLLSRIEPSTSAKAYYTARAYSGLVSDVIELQGWNKANTAEIQEILKNLRRSKEPFPLIGFLKAFAEPLAVSKSCERICNELVADLTGFDIEAKTEEGLRQLVLLNILLSGQEGITESIAKQRLIFFVKHVVPWLQQSSTFLQVRAEVCRTLTLLLPLMSDIYGEHWSDILLSLASSWKATTELEENESGMDSPVPYTHASLKLYAQLRVLTNVEDPNDDLVDVWKETEEDVAGGLINLLKHSQHFPDEFHQPLKIVNDVLARQIAKVPLKHLESTEELFPLLYVESQPVQQTAFNILHKQIPAAQEQISIDAALEKTTARLPEELLSLILEAPTVAALAEANFERTIPLTLRGYLLSWLLIFDHLEHAVSSVTYPCACRS
jgi:hypothetical protein